MKKQLLIFSLCLLCTWQATCAAASSSSAIIVTDDAVQPTEPILTTEEFLKQIGVRPKRVRVSSSGYTTRTNSSAQEACDRLVHIEEECKPLVQAIFSMQPVNETGREILVHKFILARYILSKLFNSHSHSSKKMSSFSSTTSTTSELKSLGAIISAITEDEVRYVYWNLLDEQPDTRKIFKVTMEPQKQRVTISHIRNWLGAFKRAQEEGIVDSTPAGFDEVFHSLFNRRRIQISEDRERILAHIAPGIAELRNLKIEAEQQAIQAHTPHADDANPSACGQQ